MHKQTVVDQIEVQRDGTVRVRFAKLIVNDDGTLAAEPAYHRASFEPDTDVTAGMVAIDADLSRQGFPPVDAAEVTRVISHANAARTPEVMQAHAVRKEAREKEAAHLAALEAKGK